MESKAITKMPYKERKSLVVILCFTSRFALGIFQVEILEDNLDVALSPGIYFYSKGFFRELVVSGLIKRFEGFKKKSKISENPGT